MAGNEADRSSYVRVSREVVPTPELEKFLARIEDIGRKLGDKDSTTRHESARLEEKLREGFEPRIRGIGIAALHMYPVTSLRSTLFEVRRPRSQRDNSYLKRLSDRLEPAVERIKSESPDVVTATAGYLIESTRPEHSGRVREYGVVLNDGPTQRLFVQENNGLYAQAATNVRGKVRQIEPAQITDPTIVSVLTVPGKTDYGLLQDFVEQVNEEAFEPNVHIMFEVPDQVLKRR